MRASELRDKGSSSTITDRSYLEILEFTFASIDFEELESGFELLELGVERRSCSSSVL